MNLTDKQKETRRRILASEQVTESEKNDLMEAIKSTPEYRIGATIDLMIRERVDVPQQLYDDVVAGFTKEDWQKARQEFFERKRSKTSIVRSFMYPVTVTPEMVGE
jgi:hypothetical protein